MKLINVKPSTKSDKKFVATFCMCNGESKCCDKERKKTHFGAKGMDDYTITKDKKQREAYRTRHKKDLDTKDPTRAGYLSYYLLWGESTSLQENIKDYKKRFNL